MPIREALESDLPAIVEIYNAAVPTRLSTADLTPISVESRRQWFRQHSPDRYPIWVMEIEGKTIGWLSVQMFYGRAAYAATAEVSLYVAPEYRGRGTGKQLVSHALEECPRLGIDTLICVIFAHNNASIRLFEKFGFESWGHLPKIARLDEYLADVIILGKHISDKR